MNLNLILDKIPKSPISESFRTLRTNLQFAYAYKDLKTVLVTSSNSGEGKSAISSNLAIAYAQLGKKVIIIDADMRKGTQDKIFNLKRKNGLSNYLSGVYIENDSDTSGKDKIIINKTMVQNVFLIPAGSVPPNPAELLTSSRMKKLIDLLKGKFDVIIIDAPPANLVTDAIILSKIADTVLLVCSYKETKRESLRNLKKAFESVDSKIIGMVLNKMKVTKKDRYNYYYSETKK